MKPDTFLDAVGMIDDRFLELKQPQQYIRQHRRNRTLLGIAAAAAVIVLPLPVMTAFGADSAYDILNHIAPPVAQSFTPVRMSCTDQGIQMTVISAACSGNSADCYIAMCDLEHQYPDGEWDLYDSYDLHIRRDMAGTCYFSEYDSKTDTAYFITHLETMDGSPMPRCKVTFSVSTLLTGKNKTERVLDEIDLSTVPYEPETMKRTDLRGKSCFFPDDDSPEPAEFRFLILSEEPLCTPVPGVNLRGIGYIDGALHVLTEYENILETDNHGYLKLNGREPQRSEILFSFWDDAHTNSFDEQIIPVAYDTLADSFLYGEFVTAEPCLHGNWRVTFPLE